MPKIRKTPQTASFHYLRSDCNREFKGNLKVQQCEGISGRGAHKGERCNVQVRANLPYCTSHLRSEVGFEAKESQILDGGIGLFTTIKRDSGQFLCEYKGEFLTFAQLDERYGKDDIAPYAISFNQEKGGGYNAVKGVIDAALERYYPALINDARGNSKFKNNCEVVEHAPTGAGLPSLNIYATKTILAGQELFLNYGDEYWSKESGKYKNQANILDESPVIVTDSARIRRKLYDKKK